MRRRRRGAASFLNGRRLLGLHREMRPAILAPAVLAGLLAHRACLAVAEHRDPVRPDPSGHEIVHRRARPTLAERQVVVGRPALVGMPFDEHEPPRISLHEIGVLVEELRVFRSDHVGIELEADVPKVRLRGEFLRVGPRGTLQDRKSTRLNSSHLVISYAVFCLKKKKKTPLPIPPKKKKNQKQKSKY